MADPGNLTFTPVISYVFYRRKYMKKTFFALAAAFVALGLAACLPSSSQAVDAAHNSRNSVNWDGVYTGTIPAADGSGIDVQITLNPDETYEVRYEYADKHDVFTGKGIFTWDEGGGVITLDSEDVLPYYKVGEDILIQLDMEGNEITGSLAGEYVLRKTR
jgi:uncharacterized lipoprotein NlpE involved in copper resistance